MWKKIKNIVGPCHEVNERGEIRMPLAWRDGDIVRNLIRVPSIDRAGVPYLVFHDGKGKQQNRKVHHLVADAYISNPRKLPFVTWKDGIKTNCAVSNLIRTNTRHVTPQTEGRKLNVRLVRIIRALAKRGDLNIQIAATTGVSPSMISHILHGRKWAHVN